MHMMVFCGLLYATYYHKRNGQLAAQLAEITGDGAGSGETTDMTGREEIESAMSANSTCSALALVFSLALFVVDQALPRP